MKTLQRAARVFGIEGPGSHVVGAEIIKQGARDRGLADPALIRAYHNHYRLRHDFPYAPIFDCSTIPEPTKPHASGKPVTAVRILPSNPDRLSDRNAAIPALVANMAETRENSIH